MNDMDNANVWMMSLHRADVIDFLSRKLCRKCPLLSPVLFGPALYSFLKLLIYLPPLICSEDLLS